MAEKQKGEAWTLTLRDQILHTIRILREAGRLDLEDDEENRRLVHKIRYGAAHLLTRNTIPVVDKEAAP